MFELLRLWFGAYLRIIHTRRSLMLGKRYVGYILFNGGEK